MRLFFQLLIRRCLSGARSRARTGRRGLIKGRVAPGLVECESRVVPDSTPAAPVQFQQAFADLVAAQGQFTTVVSDQSGRPGMGSGTTRQDVAVLAQIQAVLIAQTALSAGIGQGDWSASGNVAAPSPDRVTALVGVQTKLVNLLARLGASCPDAADTTLLVQGLGELSDAENRLGGLLTGESGQGEGSSAVYQQNLADLTSDQGMLVGLLSQFSSGSMCGCGSMSGSGSGSGSGSTSGSGSGSGSTSGSGSGSGSTSGSGSGSSSGSGTMSGSGSGSTSGSLSGSGSGSTSGSGSGSGSGGGSSAPETATVHLTAVGAGTPGGPRVIVYNPDGTVRFNFYAFSPSFTGGVRVAAGDVNGDGVDDIIVASGPGIRTQVLVFDGRTGQQIMSSEPFEASFTGGAYVAVGQIEGSGKGDIVVSAGETGGPRIVVIRPSDQAVLANFFAFGDTAFRGGARVAAEDLNDDGLVDLVVAPGVGGGPRVEVFNGQSLRPGSAPKLMVNDFFAMAPTSEDGLYVGAAPPDAGGSPLLLFSGGSGSQNKVVVLKASTVLGAGPAAALASPASSFQADGGTGATGARVAGPRQTDGASAVAVSFGVDPDPEVLLFKPTDFTNDPSNPTPTAQDFLTLDPSFIGGVFVS